MFTGIVEEIGEVQQCRPSGDGFVLSVRANTVLESTRLGDSIAVNGVCLTVTALEARAFSAGLAPETLKRTNLESLGSGDKVNLERAATPTTRLGGHYVQGHVDATACIRSFSKDRDALWVTLEAPRDLMKYIAPKGYVTLDGTSLTVVDVGHTTFNVTLVAYTQAHITLPLKQPGDLINLEVDVMGKYVERLLQFNQDSPDQPSNVSRAFLQENGYV